MNFSVVKVNNNEQQSVHVERSEQEDRCLCPVVME